MAAMKTLALGVGVAALMNMNSAPAMAADLGGDCCADLEERVAELEATTVRKGNRKVSLQISGHVNMAVMYWDDGLEENTYVIDNSHSASRIRFKGNAKISSDWSAGYYIELQINGGAAGASVNANNDDGGSSSPSTRQSNLYIKSQTFGTVHLGLVSTHMDDLTHNGHFLAGFHQADWHYGRGFALVNGATRTTSTISSMVHSFDSENRKDIIRYDSPTLAGFMVGASWGEDDYWEVALKYSGTVGDLKVKAKVAHANDTDATGNDDDHFKASANVMHMPTGLFVHVAYSEEDLGGATTTGDNEGYMVAAGITQKWNSLGKTSFWGAWVHSDGKAEGTTVAALGGLITSNEADRWDVGISQKIDAAAMELYAVYSDTEFDIVAGGVAQDIQDFKTFAIGARLKF